jgi:CspA family cold shock protein
MHVLYLEITCDPLSIVLKKEHYMATETHATPRNRRSFLRMVALGAGAAALAACGATAAKPSLTTEEQAALEALGDEMAADLAIEESTAVKGDLNTSGTLTGTVKFFNESKGFGFIVDESGQNIFVHISAIQDGETLQVGQQVSFNLGRGPKGPRAENVRIQ